MIEAMYGKTVSGQQIPILKERADQSREKQVRCSNTMAGKLIADLAKTSPDTRDMRELGGMDGRNGAKRGIVHGPISDM